MTTNPTTPAATRAERRAPSVNQHRYVYAVVKDYNDAAQLLAKTVTELLAEVERLRADLAWYADESNYDDEPTIEKDQLGWATRHRESEVVTDNGQRARAALSDGAA